MCGQVFNLSAQRWLDKFYSVRRTKKNSIFQQMPLMFLGFKNLPTGANQAINATQPLVLYMLIKNNEHISYRYDTRYQV
jgi:hypothetical protein